MDTHPHVVIIGAGFGGLQTARRLAKAPVRVTLVDRRNYHLFQPLLYQVATSGLAPSEIAYPLRAIFRAQRNLEFRLDEVTGIDFDARLVQTKSGQLAYDYLVIAAGASVEYFGLDTLAANAFILKDLPDAVAIRNHLLRVFEQAAVEDDPLVRQSLLTFVVVGAGPTGVESAGAISELIRLVLRRDYPRMDIDDVQILLLEAGGAVLPGFPASLQQATLRELERKHVSVRLKARVAGYDGQEAVLADGQAIPTATLLWSAGVRAAGLVEHLGLQLGRQGRVIVTPTLQVPNRPEVYVIGDAAYMEEDGQPLPMMAPVAVQQADIAADNILASIKGKPLREFKYRDPGSLATIGRNAAVARIGRWKFKGFLAWLVWLVVHLIGLIGFRNRLVVLINWAWDYFFYDRAVRLITEE